MTITQRYIALTIMIVTAVYPVAAIAYIMTIASVMRRIEEEA